MIIGLDTSCYTTSVAALSHDGETVQYRQLLHVENGRRGLRQSQAFFDHVQNLPVLYERLMEKIKDSLVLAVCASNRPRPVEGSYMPAFLAGQAFGQVIASSLSVPFYQTSHQEGHIAAAFISKEICLEGEFLALHLSGGTTDLLHVKPSLAGYGWELTRIGGSSDLHAGQMVDRIGIAMGLPFPAGPQLEALARGNTREMHRFPIWIRGLTISLSGMETAAQRMLQKGEDPAYVAYFIYAFLTESLCKLLEAARTQTGLTRCLLIGGVASSGLLRQTLADRGVMDLFYAPRELSTDNALGVAWLGGQRYVKESTSN